MIALVERVARGGNEPQPVTREQLREAAAKPKPGRPKSFVFNYRPDSKAFSLKLNFRKAQVPKEEIISALERILDDLRKS